MASAHVKMSRAGLSGYIRLIQKAQQKSLTNNALILLRAADAPDSIGCIPLGSGRSGRSASSTKLEGNLPALEASLPAHACMSQDIVPHTNIDIAVCNSMHVHDVDIHILCISGV